MPQIRLRLHNHSYPIIIGFGINNQLHGLLKRHKKKNRLFVFIDSSVYALFGKELEKSLTAAHFNFVAFVIPSGETSKSQDTLDKVYDFLLNEKISRGDFILACGGGVTTDLVGHAAATILRGVKWGIISTTLLGMVDAAIGGKTGINHKCGKNLIGAFWQPAFVICDLQYLNTLPKREFMAGLGEVLKYAGLLGGKITALLKSFPESGVNSDSKKLQRMVQLGAQYKVKIVMLDERESGQRVYLNFGHTFAHAIEKTLGYGKLLHGEAVIIGLMAAVKLSKKVKPRSSGSLDEYENLIKNFLGYVRYYPIDIESALKNMKIDKKRSGQVQKFVLLERPGKPFIASGLKEELIRESLEQCLTEYKKTGGKNG